MFYMDFYYNSIIVSNAGGHRLVLNVGLGYKQINIAAPFFNESHFLQIFQIFSNQFTGLGVLFIFGPFHFLTRVLVANHVAICLIYKLYT